MFLYSALCLAYSNYIVHLNDIIVEYLEKILTETIQGAYAI